MVQEYLGRNYHPKKRIDRFAVRVEMFTWVQYWKLSFRCKQQIFQSAGKETQVKGTETQHEVQTNTWGEQFLGLGLKYGVCVCVF